MWQHENKGFITPALLQWKGSSRAALLCVCTWSYLLKLQPSSTAIHRMGESLVQGLELYAVVGTFPFFYFHETTEQTELKWPPEFQRHGGRRLHKNPPDWVTLSYLEKFAHLRPGWQDSSPHERDASDEAHPILSFEIWADSIWGLVVKNVLHNVKRGKGVRQSQDLGVSRYPCFSLQLLPLIWLKYRRQRKAIKRNKNL